MKKWIVLFLILLATPLYAGTISTVTLDSKTVEINITQTEAMGLQIDDTIYLKGRNDEFSVKAKIQAIMPNNLVATVDFGINMLKVNGFVKVYKKDEATQVAQKPVAAAPKTPGSKKSEMSVSLMYWLGGSISFSNDYGSGSSDKEPGLMFKFCYDNVSSDGGSFGFFLQYGPTVTMENADESATLTEYGIALKTILNPGEETEFKPGLNLGYRTISASGSDDITGFGVNASLQIIPRDKKMFFDVGFLAQPNGGNADVEVTFGPILYVGGGLYL